MARIAVFASGSGTNLQALLDRFTGTDPRVALVISDRAEAGALTRARSAGVATVHLPVRGRATDEVADEMLRALEHAGIDLIALAGYMQLVPAQVVARYHDRILNIHPALLPAFGGKGMYGLRVHAAVIAAGCTITGATVHRVDERYDEGRILAQWPVPVLPDDTPQMLAARVLRIEHVLYPTVVAAVAQGRGRDAAAPDAVFRLVGSMTDIETDIAGLARW